MSIQSNPHLHTTTDPEVPVAEGVADRQPVLLAFIVGAIPLILAAASALADIFTGIPDFVVPTLAIVGTLTTGLAALWARMQVTPLAAPKLDADTLLVPETPDEHTAGAIAATGVGRPDERPPYLGHD